MKVDTLVVKSCMSDSDTGTCGSLKLVAISDSLLILFEDDGDNHVSLQSEDLFTLIESHEGKPLKLYVYNTDSDSCRELSITPNGAWGGDGR